MNSIPKNEFIRQYPCYYFNLELEEELKNDTVTIEDIVNLEALTSEHKVFIIRFTDLLTPDEKREIAADIAEFYLDGLVDPDPIMRKAIELKRRWIKNRDIDLSFTQLEVFHTLMDESRDRYQLAYKMVNQLMFQASDFIMVTRTAPFPAITIHIIKSFIERKTREQTNE